MPKEPDYTKLMALRSSALRMNGIKLQHIVEIMDDLQLLPGATEFLTWLKPIVPRTFMITDGPEEYLGDDFILDFHLFSWSWIQHVNIFSKALWPSEVCLAHIWSAGTSYGLLQFLRGGWGRLSEEIGHALKKPEAEDRSGAATWRTSFKGLFNLSISHICICVESSKVL